MRYQLKMLLANHKLVQSNYGSPFVSYFWLPATKIFNYLLQSKSRHHKLVLIFNLK